MSISRDNLGYVEVVFTRRRALGSLALRTYLWSDWSHCGIVDGDYVIDASTHGIRRTPLKEFLKGVSKHEIVRIRANNPRAVIDAAITQLGKKYDWLGVAGILARRKIDRPTRWFCSELVAWAFEQGGSPIFRVKVWRITPRDIYVPILTP